MWLEELRIPCGFRKTTPQSRAIRRDRSCLSTHRSVYITGRAKATQRAESIVVYRISGRYGPASSTVFYHMKGQHTHDWTWHCIWRGNFVYQIKLRLRFRSGYGSAGKLWPDTTFTWCLPCFWDHGTQVLGLDNVNIWAQVNGDRNEQQSRRTLSNMNSLDLTHLAWTSCCNRHLHRS